MARLSLFTLVLAATVAQLSLLSSANALQNVVPHRRAVEPVVHLDLNKRMLRKRKPQDIVPIGAAGDPADSSSSTSTASSTSTRATSTPQSQSTPTSQTSRSNSSSSTQSTQTSSSTSASSSSSTSLAPTSSSTPSAAPSSQSSTQSTRSTSRGTSTVVYTATQSATETPAAQDPNNSFLPKSAIVGLIVAGSCIAAGAAIWTVIRKWKFSPSRQFEDRLEPINWEPTQSSGLPTDKNEHGLSRPGSNRNSLGDGSVRNMASANHDAVSMTPDFPPAHDFTAGPTNGYVNMYRGASPAPPSAYGGHYETPNPYDAYDYNNTNPAAAYGQRRY